MKRDRVYLQHVDEAAGHIESFIGLMKKDDFIGDTLVQSAVIRQLEVIGEAVKNLSGGLRRKHKGIPWKDIAGLRDKLIHGYFGVDLELVWRIATKNIPELKSQISEILAETDLED